MKMMPPTFGPS